VHEARGCRRPWSGLHLIDLRAGTRHTLELSADADYDLRITGVDYRSIWVASRRLAHAWKRRPLRG
jgi:hypothetical protein